MSPKVLISFVCLVSTSLLKAQYDDLLRNSDITWVAENTADFEMNPENENELYPPRFNYLDVIKFQNSGIENGLYGRKIFAQKYLSQQILKNANNEGFLCYKDSLLSSLMTREEFFSTMTKIDTGYSMCEGGNEPMIIKNDVSFEQIWGFRIRQVFWYNQKNKTFESRLLAYAPVIDTKDNEGNFAGIRTLFWLKADPNPPKWFKNKRFNYVFQTKMKDNAPGFEDFKVIKGRFDFKKFFEAEIGSPSHQFLSWDNYSPANMQAFRVECFGTDTIVAFHPETYEERISIEHRNCINQIEKVRFVQNWYYDERRNRLYARLVGVAPLAAIRDSEGNFRYYRPLFYQMYR